MEKDYVLRYGYYDANRRSVIVEFGRKDAMRDCIEYNYNYKTNKVTSKDIKCEPLI